MESEVTPFQRKVYDAALAIPVGKVWTYGGLARSIGCKSSRAVGQALRRNPFAPEVPCHRIIRGDGTLGGYQGAIAGPSLRTKRKRLEGEGVIFLPGGQVHPDCILK